MTFLEKYLTVCTTVVILAMAISAVTVPPRNWRLFVLRTVFLSNGMIAGMMIAWIAIYYLLKS